MQRSVTHRDIVIDGKSATPEQIADFERRTNIDLDMDGTIAGERPAAPEERIDHLVAGAAGPPTSTPPPLTPPMTETPADPAAQRVELLERLARLRDEGALTPMQFEREKRRILDEG